MAGFNPYAAGAPVFGAYKQSDERDPDAESGEHQEDWPKDEEEDGDEGTQDE